MVRKTTVLGLLILSAMALAQGARVVSETGRDRFDADFPSGGQLRLQLRSGDVQITGSSENKITVRYGGEKAYLAKDVRVTWETQGDTGDLRLSGGPRNQFQILIGVPAQTNLYVRMPFGSLKVEKIRGSKDVELHAGDLDIGIGDRDDYAHVDASVLSGSLDSKPFGVSKGGLFRSFGREGVGRYTLHAHVGAGQLTLR